MARINLLPWREQLREERKREFLTILVGIVVVGLLLIGVADRFYTARIERQEARNNYLEAQQKIQEDKIKEIDHLKAESAQMMERTKIIQDLEADRQEVGHLFDQLARTLPDDVFYTEVKYAGGVLSLSGIANDNALISELMRRLDASAWLASPVLVEVRAEPSGTQVQFRLEVKAVKPAVTEGGN